MRIVHFSDVHLGADMTGPVDPETGLNARLMDFLRSLDAIMNYVTHFVKENPVDLVLFTGDAFKTRTPSPTLVREFAIRIAKMASVAPVVMVTGNHDLPGAVGKAHTLEIFRALNVDNVHVCDTPATHVIETKNGYVQVVAIPWATRHQLMAQEKVQGLTAEEINVLIGETVATTIGQMAMQLDPEIPSILAGHMTVMGGAFGSERSVMLGSDVVIPLEAVANNAFDYVALGHLHRYQMLRDSDPPVVYSGSTERIDFGEEKEEKGFVVVTLGKAVFAEGVGLGIEFVPLNVREFVTIEVSVDGSNPTAAVMEAIAAQDLEDKVVRVIINATAEGELLLDEAEIQKALAPAFRVASFTKKVERAERARLGELDYREMGPMELLEAYLESKGTPEEEQEALVKAAGELIREGE